MTRQVYRGGSIPGGHVIGRTSNGQGAAELIPFNDLNRQLVAAGGGSSEGGGGSYTAGTGLTLTGRAFSLTNPVTVALGGTGLASGTSGGIPAYTGSTTITSSGVLAASTVVVGGGAAAVPTTVAGWTKTVDGVNGGNVLNINANAAAATSPGDILLHLTDADAGNGLLLMDTAAAPAKIVARRANTSIASPSALASGNVICNYSARGYGSTAYGADAGGFRMVANQTWTDANQGCRVEVIANPDGSTTASLVATLKPAGCSFTATNTNDSAAAGNYGEFISSVILIANEVSLTSTVTADVTTVVPTAGDWELSGEVWFDLAAGTTVSNVNVGINSVTASIPTVPAVGTGRTDVFPSNTTGGTLVIPVGPVRVSQTCTNTYYLSVNATFAVSTAKVDGKFVGRRPR